MAHTVQVISNLVGRTAAVVETKEYLWPFCRQVPMPGGKTDTVVVSPMAEVVGVYLQDESVRLLLRPVPGCGWQALGEAWASSVSILPAKPTDPAMQPEVLLERIAEALESLAETVPAKLVSLIR